MTIDTITVGGYANLKEVVLKMPDILALVAPNNYGKTNVLKAVKFGIDFISPVSDKNRQMSRSQAIPLIEQMVNDPFIFNVIIEMEGLIVEYGFSFIWARNMKNSKGAEIISESLKVKKVGDPKFKVYINRNEPNKASYLSSVEGRCSSSLSLDGKILATNKLSNYDNLFYIDMIKSIERLSIKQINTLRNPDDFFSMLSMDAYLQDNSLAFPKTGQIGFFLNSLQTSMPDKFEILKDTIKQLLPEIEDIKPIKIDFAVNERKKDLPFKMPDFFYDVRVKEKFFNQRVSFDYISSGSKRVIYILSMVIAANLNKIDVITIEELENSVHPRLLQNLLQAISTLAGNTKIIITSHSPYLVKYLAPSNLRFGLPKIKGVSCFKALKESKLKKLSRMASSQELSVGEYMFDGMLDMDSNSEEYMSFFI